MKLTLLCPKECDGFSVSERLRTSGFECEYADAEYVVMMISAETGDEELDALVRAMGKTHMLRLLRSPLRFRRHALL